VAGEKNFSQFWVTWVVAAATSAGAVPVGLAAGLPVGLPVGLAAGLVAAGGVGVGVGVVLFVLLEQEVTSSAAPSTEAADLIARSLRMGFSARWCRSSVVVTPRRRVARVTLTMKDDRSGTRNRRQRMDDTGPGAASRVDRPPVGRLRGNRLLSGPGPGWLLAALGGALCVLGWYAVSGESVTARQLPYLASATAPGIALLTGGLVWLAVRAAPPAGTGEPAAAPDWQAPEAAGEPGVLGGGLVAVPGGTLCHRPGCPLVAGKEQAVPVDAAAVRERGLAPCPVCEPDIVPAPGPGASS
jgi:hypothetical protein